MPAPTQPASCPRCGGPLAQPNGRGRRRTWCSAACRRRASEERQAAARGAIAVRTVAVAPPPGKRDLEESVRKVAASPAACRNLLRLLLERSERGGMDSAAWERTVEAVFDLAEGLANS